ncbi:DNA primase [Brachybacterium sp. EF45031]|uniref:DNA primase n=1 Tax=Brachybacterium sillae TaxID=2810536 RepID=UPI00217CE119|nr:DNA primase [Brachybacterium sillae]MCS6710685.1 DNA primase [Brachybacterium sillae]
MSTDPRTALTALISALERHYEASASSRGEDDPALDAATDALTSAFDDYDEALFEAFDVATPFVVFDGDDEDLDEDDDEDFDDFEDYDDEDDDLDEDFEDDDEDDDRD